MNKLRLRKMLESFYLEDLGVGDITSEALVSATAEASGHFLVKQNGYFSGKEVLIEAFRLFDPGMEIVMLKEDGERIEKGERIALVTGRTRDLLMAERVVLNLIQRMSGIATMTRKAVSQLGASHTKVCDTRKTTPGLRMVEKYAVTCGGGVNHRFGLYDGVMIKDNHIAYAGSITKAVKLVKEKCGPMVKIEVETENEGEVLEAVEAGADLIMFDNCTPEEAKHYLTLTPAHIITEISGGITLDQIGEYKETGVDYISLGALTHSIQALDISFNLEGGEKA